MPNHPNRNKIRDWPNTLRGFRVKNSLTQKKLAALLQTSLRNVENWEAGVNRPPAYLKKALDAVQDGLGKGSET